MMAAKRGPGPELIPNPFIKKRNLAWRIEAPTSSPTAGSSSAASGDPDPAPASAEDPSAAAEDGPDATAAAEAMGGTAAVEAGRMQIDDHLEYFSGVLSRAAAASSRRTQGPDAATPLLPIPRYRALYATNAGSAGGAHFVVHQHDHPVAGTHYDLRLQINGTSSVSWAIMYGLPGDPNSRRLNRNATETRVHCLWNHLIETASTSTGSLLIWDTGTYAILPSEESQSGTGTSTQTTPTSCSSSGAGQEEEEESAPTEQTNLHRAFQARKIRLRLRGARLPDPYVLNLRLPRAEDRRAAPPAKKRSRRTAAAVPAPASSSDSDGAETAAQQEVEAEAVRATNAYPGAENSVGSVYQRRWYASLDRAACGFIRRRAGGGRGGVVWEPVSAREEEESDGGGDVGKGKGKGEGRLGFPFYVRGVTAERSVVTGRLGADVLADEGVEGFVGRRGWRPVLD